MLGITDTGASYDRVRAWARSDGDRDAVVDLVDGSGAALSYADLVKRADVLAAQVRAHCAGHDQPVAVLLGRPGDTIVAMLATIAAGAVYCPLDTEVPDSRLAAVMERLAVRVAIADAAHAWRLPAEVIALLPYGDDALTESLPVAPKSPEDLARQGRPKVWR
jgi:non-ribosomal peptide synthetase component F